MIYDCIVIGRGLIGSAAAKYISNSVKKVLLIGPDEETVLQQQIVFASHYDRARIQRIFGRDEIATLLNQQSANAYSSIQNESGIHFHSTEGCLYVSPYGVDSYLENILEQSKKFTVNFQSFDSAESLNSFTSDYHFPSSSKGIFEEAPSGHINPRLLIKAQLNLFGKNGGEIFNDTAADVSNKNNEIKITTLSGKIFYSKKVLLAPGAFVNFFNLLPQKVFLTMKSESTIWVKTTSEEGLRLSKLPSLLYKIKEPEIDDIYLIRPLQYPDGNFYLKMGANFPSDVFFTNLNEIQDWFKTGNNEANLKILKDYLLQLIPSISIEISFTKKCIVCYTRHGKPYIGEVENNLFVAAGGNGYSAMSSDALGKLAATVLLENNFPQPFSAHDFRPVFAEQ
ncbi:MAG: NAD(P)/FAD-dependent oxidoreductase [Ginsengibacter sp.]